MLVAEIRGIAQRQSTEVERIVREHFGGRDEFQPVPGRMIKLVRDGEVIVLDVRPGREFISGHIPARSTSHWSNWLWVQRHCPEPPRLSPIAAALSACFPMKRWSLTRTDTAPDDSWKVIRNGRRVACLSVEWVSWRYYCLKAIFGSSNAFPRQHVPHPDIPPGPDCRCIGPAPRNRSPFSISR